jgi:putative drug exporter of the RND superfamily
MLVPAIMHTLGKANWYFPSWLERRLPRLEVERQTELKREHEAQPLEIEPALAGQR